MWCVMCAITLLVTKYSLYGQDLCKLMGAGRTEGPPSLLSSLTCLWPLHVVIWTCRLSSFFKTHIVYAPIVHKQCICMYVLKNYNGHLKLKPRQILETCWDCNIQMWWVTLNPKPHVHLKQEARGFCSESRCITGQRQSKNCGWEKQPQTKHLSKQTEKRGGRKIHVNPASPGNVIQGK